MCYQLYGHSVHRHNIAWRMRYLLPKKTDYGNYMLCDTTGPGDQEKPRSVPSLQYVSELMSERDMSSRAHVTYTVRDSLVGNYLLPRPSFCLQSILVQLKCRTWFKLRRTVIHVKYGNVNLPITNENTRETNILISQQNVTRKNNQFERVYILFRGSLEVIWLRKSNFSSPTVN